MLLVAPFGAHCFDIGQRKFLEFWTGVGKWHRFCDFFFPERVGTLIDHAAGLNRPFPCLAEAYVRIGPKAQSQALALVGVSKNPVFLAGNLDPKVQSFGLVIGVPSWPYDFFDYDVGKLHVHSCWLPLL
jgi:hypothetical protein